MAPLHRRLSSLFAVSARHDIAIRRAWPTWLRGLVLLLALVIVVAVTWLVARYAFPPPPPPLTPEQVSAQEREDALNKELADMRRRNASLESELSMNEGSQTTLTQHAEALEQENAQLKEELTYLQKLVADATREAGAKIQDVRLEAQGNRAYRYRILLVQGGNPKSDFVGTVKLLAYADAAPASGAAPLPIEAVPNKDASGTPPDLSAPLPVEFKYYQRLEGVFRAPEGKKVQQFAVQVFKKDADSPAITRSITLK